MLERIRSGTPLEAILADSASATNAPLVDASLDASFVSSAGNDENAENCHCGPVWTAVYNP